MPARRRLSLSTPRPRPFSPRYVSFAEILMRKSIAGFQAVSNGDADAAFRWTTLCFFGGMAVIALLDRVRCLRRCWLVKAPLSVLCFAT